MSRRASSKVHPGLIIGIVVAVGVLFVVGKSMFAKKQAGFGDVPKLVMEDYLENANSLRGSTYVVEGEIEEKLRWTSDNGQVVSVLVGPESEHKLIAITIPAKFNKLNIERKQRYSFRVEFQQGGIPVASDINRL